MDEPMKGAGGEQKGGGWEKEEEGEGRQATPWQPQRRLAGDGTPVTVSSPCPSFPALHRDGPAPSSPLRPLPSLRVPPGGALPTSPHRTLHSCVPDSPTGVHLVSPLPRGVSIPGASGAPPSPPRAAAPDCPNAILESPAPAESCVGTSRAAAPRPRGGEAGRSAGRSPDTRDPAAALGAQGARPAAEVQLRLAFRGSQARLEGSWGTTVRAAEGSSALGFPTCTSTPSPRPAPRAPRGRGNPGPRHAPRAPRGR
ncbi:nascent polypeptide-associated complex subunit alpha, muscle-specific form-like [Onychomys torridus]|uniref:nascent polypeptide-associated complex subunit alpha, muscle-specific form-like n=1 Tax=Onychomys torridus TaxID=38674 RepID=UPI00167F34BC|nr:nascent polypeptide-associated complex subunit alpha, muscle-specific form-like [Onychomys torridus]